MIFTIFVLAECLQLLESMSMKGPVYFRLVQASLPRISCLTHTLKRNQEPNTMFLTLHLFCPTKTSLALASCNELLEGSSKLTAGTSSISCHRAAMGKTNSIRYSQIRAVAVRFSVCFWGAGPRRFCKMSMN